MNQPPLPRRTRGAVTVALVGLVTLAACSSTSGSKSPSAPSARSGGSANVTATEIHVGGIVGNTLFADATEGAKARFKQVNDAGGINGRKIVLDTVSDDGNSAATTLSAARALVDQNKVLAVVPVVTTFFPNAAQYLKQQAVPAFGFGIDTSWCNDTYTFAFNGCPSLDTATQPNVAAPVGALFADKTVKGHSIAIIGDDGDSSRQIVKAYGAVLKEGGANVVLQQNTLPAAGGTPVSDFTPYLSQVMASNSGKAPEYVMNLSTAQNVIGMYGALQKAGYHGLYQDFVMYDPRLVSVAKGANELFPSQPFEAGLAGVKQMVAAVKASDPKAALTQPLAYGYWAADLFVKAVQKAGSNLTRDSLVAALNNGLKYDDSQGIGRADFPQMHTESSGCFSAVSSDGTKYQVKYPLTCRPLIANPLKK